MGRSKRGFSSFRTWTGWGATLYRRGWRIIAGMAEPGTRRGAVILGVRIDDITEDEALEILVGFIRGGAGHRIVTPNPEIVMAARRSPAYRRVLNAADLSIPDGVGLLLAARLQGTRLRAHVRGTDLVLRLAERSVGEGWRWFLLGAAPGVAVAAATALARRFPGIAIAGAAPGGPGPEQDAACRRMLGAAGPIHVLLVAYGAPAQEEWIARNQAQLPIPVQIGVGGAFNFIAGRSPRAPGWLRRLELEWAYRLATEPWRWRRQLALPAFASLALVEAIRHRVGASR